MHCKEILGPWIFRTSNCGKTLAVEWENTQSPDSYLVLKKRIKGLFLGMSGKAQPLWDNWLNQNKTEEEQ